MYGIFTSMIGVVNGIFAVSMILLTFRFWNKVNVVLKIILIIAISLFTIIQPIMVYLGARKQVKTVPAGMKLNIDKEGVNILTPKESSMIKWKQVKGVTKKLDMVILYTTEEHGFIISNRLLKGKMEEFYNYVVSSIKRCS